MTKDRFVITGLGLTSPIGNNLREHREGILNQKSGITHEEIRHMGKVPLGKCSFDEFKYQFNLLSNYIKIEHVSSHEHVHMIPPLFEKIEKFCNSNDVKYLRNFNENLSFNSISEFINFFYDSNYLKFSVLKICQSKLKNKSYIYTYGLKNSGKIAFDGLSRLIKRYKDSKPEIEIYLHPAFKYECETDYNLKDYDLNFIKSYERVKEYEFINSLSINQLNEYN